MNAFHYFIHTSFSYSCHLVDDNTGISYVFEMRIGMNDFDHRILALLKQQRERPEKFRPCHLVLKTSLGYTNKVRVDFSFLLSQSIYAFFGYRLLFMLVVNNFVHWSNIVENDLCCIGEEM